MDEQHLPTGDKGPSMLAAQYVVVPIATVMALLRLYVRCIRRNTAGWDDLFIFVAGATAVVGMACGQVFVDWGMGQHVWNLSSKQISMAIKWLTIAELLNYGGLCMVRLSVGFFLLRLLPSLSGGFVAHRKIIIIAMVVNVLVSQAVIVVFATQCVPLDGLWNQNVSAKCFAPGIATAVNRLFSSISAAIDFAFSLLPLLIIRKLQMSRRSKITTSLCLSLGFCAGIVAIVKAAIVHIGTADPTYDLSDVTICATIEVNIGIIAACLPGLRQFVSVTSEDVKEYLSRRSSTHGSSKSAGSAPSSRTNTEMTEGIVKQTETTVYHSCSRNHAQGSAHYPRDIV